MTMAPTKVKAAEIIRRLSDLVRLMSDPPSVTWSNFNLPFELVKGRNVLHRTRFNEWY